MKEGIVTETGIKPLHGLKEPRSLVYMDQFDYLDDLAEWEEAEVLKF